MKKFLIAFIFILLVGCSSSLAKNDGRFIQLSYDNFSNGSIAVIKDMQTGCQYILMDGSYSGAVTLMYNEDGKPLCGGLK